MPGLIPLWPAPVFRPMDKGEALAFYGGGPELREFRNGPSLDVSGGMVKIKPPEPGRQFIVLCQRPVSQKERTAIEAAVRAKMGDIETVFCQMELGGNFSGKCAGIMRVYDMFNPKCENMLERCEHQGEISDVDATGALSCNHPADTLQNNLEALLENSQEGT